MSKKAVDLRIMMSSAEIFLYILQDYLDTLL